MSNKDNGNNAQNTRNKVKENDNISINNSFRNISSVSNNKTKYHLIPIIIVLCIIPLIMRMKIYNTKLSQFPWFSSNDQYMDFFLIYKQWAFIGISAIMALVIVINVIIKKRRIKFSLIFVPLFIYGLLAFFSAVFSKYSAFSFSGSFELFESVFALLGYCFTAYYAFLLVNSEQDLKLIYIYLMVIALTMGALGLTQILGHDFFTTQLGYNLITPGMLRGTEYELTFDKIYLTLYNPNYVGVYVALLLPIFLTMTFLSKKIILGILSGISVIGLGVCIAGSGSLAGMIGLGAGILCFLIFMWRYIIKYFFISIPIAVIAAAGFVFVFSYKDNYFVNKVKEALQITKVERALTNMETEDDKISLTYNGNVMNVMYTTSENQARIIAYDNDSLLIPNTYDDANKWYTVADERFPNFILGFDQEIEGVFYIQINGKRWRFTNMAGDNTYYYLNRYNKLDKIVTASSAIFTGYEGIISNRGYIWSRTIPLIKDNIILGSGPDTFTMVFPQQDYMNLFSYGYETSIITKPHSLYLQMAVQTGLLSLLAFLVFYGIYFISSVRLYIKGCFGSLYAKLGFGIFIGTISYMVAGITNDSNINTAPVFWTLIGVGIAANYKAKTFIWEEVALIKEKKAKNKIQ